MASTGAISLLALVLVVSVQFVCSSTVPEQIHITLTGKNSEMVVSWLTPNKVSNPTVMYGTSPTNLSQKASAFKSTYYVYPPDFYESGEIYHAMCTGLSLNTVYYYKVGDASGGYSKVFSFNTERQLPVEIICVGDIGHSKESDITISHMTNASKSRHIDYVFHAGDLSYANLDQPIWDTWMNTVQPLASTVPYMAAVGNHELFSLFLAYDTRFHNPGTNSGSHSDTYWSFNYENVHAIALSSEQISYGHWTDQYTWLEKDLQSIDRKVTPWVILSWHSPWYTSNKVHTHDGDSMREELEDLLYKYKVDLVLVGHVHAYERTTTVYNGTVTADAPAYILNGNGGNGEGLYNSWIDPQPAWSVKRDAYYGYGSLTVYNSTHMYWQAFNVITDTVTDDWWFVRQH